MDKYNHFKNKLSLLKKNSKTGLYNFLVGRYTIYLYKNFFKNIPDNSTVLDIGVGDGYSILENIDLVKSKNLKIYAVDINKEDISIFRKRIQELNLNSYFEVYDVGVEDIEKETGNRIPVGIDYVFFSNSYSVIPQIKDIIFYVKKTIEPKFFVISTTLGGNSNSILSLIKPNLSKVTLGIDFGRYISYTEFMNEIKSYSLTIVHQEITHSNFIPFWGEINVFTFVLKNQN